MTEKGSNKKSISVLIRWILIAVCAIVFCGSAAHLLFYAKDKLDAEKAFEQTRNRDLAELYAQNSDLIGWIEIEGTKIDYPVMQTPDDPEYYLHRDFNREYSASGTPFLDSASVVLPKDNAVTWNWLIYGHNMKFGTMFIHQPVDSIQYEICFAGCTANTGKYLFCKCIHDYADISVFLCAAATMM